jgi:hypothetical protein
VEAIALRQPTNGSSGFAAITNEGNGSQIISNDFKIKGRVERHESWFIKLNPSLEKFVAGAGNDHPYIDKLFALHSRNDTDDGVIIR